MSLNKITAYLNKFKKITPSDSFIKNNLINAIYIVLNIKIKKQEISVQNNIVILKTHPIIKKEIIMQKKIILDYLNKQINSVKKVRDIY